MQTQVLTDRSQRTTTVKNQHITENSAVLLKRQKEQTEDTQIEPGNKNIGANNSIPNNNKIKNKNNNYHKNCNISERKPKTFYPPYETCGKTNHSTEKCY